MRRRRRSQSRRGGVRSFGYVTYRIYLWDYLYGMLGGPPPRDPRWPEEPGPGPPRYAPRPAKPMRMGGMPRWNHLLIPPVKDASSSCSAPPGGDAGVSTLALCSFCCSFVTLCPSTRAPVCIPAAVMEKTNSSSPGAPDEDATRDAASRTRFMLVLSSMSPRPSWPRSFLPQVYISPCDVSAAQCQSPATTWTIGRWSSSGRDSGCKDAPIPGRTLSTRASSTLLEWLPFVGVEYATMAVY